MSEYAFELSRTLRKCWTFVLEEKPLLAISSIESRSAVCHGATISEKMASSKLLYHSAGAIQRVFAKDGHERAGTAAAAADNVL